MRSCATRSLNRLTQARITLTPSGAGNSWPVCRLYSSNQSGRPILQPRATGWLDTFQADGNSAPVRRLSSMSRPRPRHLAAPEAKHALLACPVGKQAKKLSIFQSSLRSFKSIKSLDSSSPNMKVLPVRALQDNYMYLLIDECTKHAAAVDPVNASAMADAIAEQGVDLKAVLTTHHHYDHAHGNADMLSMFPDATVYGGDPRIQAITKQVTHGELIRIGTLTIECLSTPCHTKGHICYYAVSELDAGQPAHQGSSPSSSTVTSLASLSPPASAAERAVFTGDTLFIAGCGRFFEGTSEQMNQNLNVILASLPPDTRVYCGHEYTVANLKFALSVEPQNVDIKSKLAWAQSKVAKKEPTVPSSIGEEKRINPFMRLKRTAVKKYTGETDELEVMAILRQRKNDFQA